MKQEKRRKQKPRQKTTIIHRVENITIDIKEKGQKRRLLRVQRYRKPIKVYDRDLSKNPDKLTFYLHKTPFGDRIELFCYKNNPKKFFFSINGQLVGLKHFKWREIQSSFMKLGKYLGFLK